MVVKSSPNNQQNFGALSDGGRKRGVQELEKLLIWPCPTRDVGLCLFQCTIQGCRGHWPRGICIVIKCDSSTLQVNAMESTRGGGGIYRHRGGPKPLQLGCSVEGPYRGSTGSIAWHTLRTGTIHLHCAMLEYRRIGRGQYRRYHLRSKRPGLVAKAEVIQLIRRHFNLPFLNKRLRSSCLSPCGVRPWGLEGAGKGPTASIGHHEGHQLLYRKTRTLAEHILACMYASIKLAAKDAWQYRQMTRSGL